MNPRPHPTAALPARALTLPARALTLPARAQTLPARALTLPLAALLLGAVALGCAPTMDSDTTRHGDPAVLQPLTPTGTLGPKHGEWGLWVRFHGDSLRASWITRERGPGFFEARSPGGSAPLRSVTTGAGWGHSAAVARPEEGGVVLRYGMERGPGDRHETRLRLDPAFGGTGEMEPGVPPGPEARPSPVVSGVDSLYVIADIHGEYDNMVDVFRNAGLIDRENRWSGGTAHLAVLGDMLSRGDHATAVAWFLYRLEAEAEAAGGRVHIVLGNHEIMVMLNDLRYVQAKERRIAGVHGVPYHRMYDPRRSVLGRWLARKPAVLQVDEVLLAHGGVSGDYVGWTPQAIHDSLATFISEDAFYHWDDDAYWDGLRQMPMDSVAFERRMDFFWEDRSPLWHRDYVQTDVAGPELERVLESFGAALHVVGHTPVETIHERYDGRLIPVNTFPFAAEVLLLVREGPGQYARFRIGWEGGPERL